MAIKVSMFPFLFVNLKLRWNACTAMNLCVYTPQPALVPLPTNEYEPLFVLQKKRKRFYEIMFLFPVPVQF